MRLSFASPSIVEIGTASNASPQPSVIRTGTRLAIASMCLRFMAHSPSAGVGGDDDDGLGLWKIVGDGEVDLHHHARRRDRLQPLQGAAPQPQGRLAGWHVD